MQLSHDDHMILEGFYIHKAMWPCSNCSSGSNKECDRTRSKGPGQV